MTFSDMSKNFDAEPGDIFYMQQNAVQLAYAFREIARYWKNQILVDELDIPPHQPKSYQNQMKSAC